MRIQIDDYLLIIFGIFYLNFIIYFESRKINKIKFEIFFVQIKIHIKKILKFD